MSALLVNSSVPLLSPIFTVASSIASLSTTPTITTTTLLPYTHFGMPESADPYLINNLLHHHNNDIKNYDDVDDNDDEFKHHHNHRHHHQHHNYYKTTNSSKTTFQNLKNSNSENQHRRNHTNHDPRSSTFGTVENNFFKDKNKFNDENNATFRKRHRTLHRKRSLYYQYPRIYTIYSFLLYKFLEISSDGNVSFIDNRGSPFSLFSILIYSFFAPNERLNSSMMDIKLIYANLSQYYLCINRTKDIYADKSPTNPDCHFYHNKFNNNYDVYYSYTYPRVLKRCNSATTSPLIDTENSEHNNNSNNRTNIQHRKQRNNRKECNKQWYLGVDKKTKRVKIIELNLKNEASKPSIFFIQSTKSSITSSHMGTEMNKDLYKNVKIVHGPDKTGMHLKNLPQYADMSKVIDHETKQTSMKGINKNLKSKTQRNSTRLLAHRNLQNVLLKRNKSKGRSSNQRIGSSKGKRGDDCSNLLKLTNCSPLHKSTNTLITTTTNDSENSLNGVEHPLTRRKFFGKFTNNENLLLG